MLWNVHISKTLILNKKRYDFEIWARHPLFQNWKFSIFFLKKNFSEISKIVKEMIRILELEGV